MTLEAMLNDLSHKEKLAAMDLLWRDLSANPSVYISPKWHEKVIGVRLARPAAGDSLGLAEAKTEIMENLNARRAQS